MSVAHRANLKRQREFALGKIIQRFVFVSGAFIENVRQIFSRRAATDFQP